MPVPQDPPRRSASSAEGARESTIRHWLLLQLGVAAAAWAVIGVGIAWCV